jgi:hypothetical protein
MMKCLKCGHEWEPKVEQPARCPNCKTATYMFPPGVGFGRAVPRVSEGDQGVYNPRRVIAEPKGWNDPTPLVMVEEMPLAEARRRYPDAAIFDPEHPAMADEVANVSDALRGETAHPIEEGEALFALDESKEPDMDELRKIASGELDPTGYKRPPARETATVGMCEYRELDPESNEWVYCSLPIHDPKKQRHVPGRRESA